MIKSKKWIPNPEFDTSKPHHFLENRAGTWLYEDLKRPLAIGDIVGFLCNGRGRGGHCHVTAVVTKVNRKTFDATEIPRSYNPGTRWRQYLEPGPGNGEVVVELNWIPLISKDYPDGIHYKARMMYEDPPLKDDKGKYLGSCNRRACQAPGADWYNFVTKAHYCERCAGMINYAPLPDGRYLCSKGENNEGVDPPKQEDWRKEYGAARSAVRQMKKFG